MRHIEPDYQRYKKIIEGKVRKDFDKYIQQERMIGRRGNDQVIIPVPKINIPHFEYDHELGLDSGEGPGTDIEEHLMEEWSRKDLVDLMCEELELPRIKPEGKKLVTKNKRYSSISRAGSIPNFKRTFKEALKRQLADGSYDPRHPCVIPIRDDKRYLAPTEHEQEIADATIIAIRDISGSMKPETNDILRSMHWWLELYLEEEYPGVKTLYVVHDSEAKKSKQGRMVCAQLKRGNSLRPSVSPA